MSDERKTKEAKPKAEPTPAALCACGCGTATGKRSDWRQGHDQRAKGWLQRAIAGRMLEGERAKVAALLGRESAKRALASATFAPLAEAARAKLAETKAA